MSRKLVSLLFGVAVLVSAVPALAHHSVSAEFDTTKPITFSGTVTGVNWGNPHIYTSIQTMDPASGKAVVYEVEGGAPNALFRAGWRKDTLKIGESVSVSGMRAKNPESMHVGQATITTTDGKKIFSGQNKDAAAAQ
jgi:hypothetical protein